MGSKKPSNKANKNTKRHHRANEKAIQKEALSAWRVKVHEIIFEADTPAGKGFDVALLIAILVSVVAVMLESVEGTPSDPSLVEEFKTWFVVLEWTLTILFTIEYILRILSIGKPWKYVFSFYGMIDLLSILPSFLGLFVTGAGSLRVIRMIRLLRIFRVLKLAQFVGEGNLLIRALRDSRAKITVFMVGVLSLVTILGTMMYLIEDPESGFTSIPRSIYWAIVTMTTVGYGDIAPQTVLGQTLASIVMILGYAIIAVPTGIVSAQIIRPTNEVSSQSCPQCAVEGHYPDAKYCFKCGSKL